MALWLEILLVVVKAALAMGLLLQLAALTIWVERKAAALIQDRLGANRASILGFDLAGILNTLVADPIKALMKEDFVPKGVSQFMHCLGPFLAVFPVIASFAVIPFGPSLYVGGNEIRLQLANLNVGVLYVFAMGSIAVYGVAFAGWVSRNKFSLFGGLRATAQMISYEITMGISLVGILIVYQTLDLALIVERQSGVTDFGLPNWGVLLNPVGFLIFFISMMAETKRAPFDLPESESELVAGYLTEYSGMKFLLFWLGEFAEIVVASALVVLLFFGGWQLPWYDIRQIPADVWGFLPLILTLGMLTHLAIALRILFTSPKGARAFGFQLNALLTVVTGGLAYGSTLVDWNALNFQWAPLIGVGVFGAKVALFCVLQVVIRWTLPRFRYDQLMALCWKIMLPICLVNVLVTAVVVLSGVSLGIFNLMMMALVVAVFASLKRA